MLVDQPRLPTYHAFVVHARFVPTDQDVGRLNRAIDAVAREFGSHVIVVHTDPRLGKRAAHFQADGLHPNVLGHAVIAGLIDNAIMHSGMFAPVSDRRPVYSAPDNRVQRRDCGDDQ